MCPRVLKLPFCLPTNILGSVEQVAFCSQVLLTALIQVRFQVIMLYKLYCSIMGPPTKSRNTRCTQQLHHMIEAYLKTVQKLKVELSARGITFTTSMNKSQLILLFISVQVNVNIASTISNGTLGGHHMGDLIHL